MCGIVGYVGPRDCVDLLIDGLKRLEYRGYDSAGIAVQNGKGIEVQKAAGKIPLRLHFHDTRNTGLANAFAGVEAGVDVLDASVGGLGGCPFAPNATGNIGTEDLVYMLERAGYETGYDLDQLIEIGNWASDLLGKRVASSVARAGGFPQMQPVPVP